MAGVDEDIVSDYIGGKGKTRKTANKILKAARKMFPELELNAKA